MACRTYKRFLEPKEVYLGDNTIVYAQGQGTQLLQIGPYILVLSVWFVPDPAHRQWYCHLNTLLWVQESVYSLLSPARHWRSAVKRQNQLVKYPAEGIFGLIFAIDVRGTNK
jgi:hypothetical protein